MPKIKIPIITVICFVGFIFIEPTLYLVLIFLSVLLHEAGHLSVMALFGIGIEKITLLPIGIDIKRKQKYISYPKEIILSLAGIAVNILVFFIIRKYEFFAYTNLLYALVNLIPIKGLDGSYALEAFLLSVLECDRAEAILKTVSFVFVILLWMLGVYILFILNGNISIFALSVFLFLSTNMK
ncbi:MAG: hypothetical protein IKU19_03640 [Clostridia bacterium]|nr:hypothetical protein [Clostridia bacterium]